MNYPKVIYVAEKKKAGWMIPDPLLDRFRAIAGEGNGKEHWLLASAAILALLELPDAVRAHYVAEIWKADRPQGSYAELLARLASGDLRREGEHRARTSEAIRSGTLTQGADSDASAEEEPPATESAKPPKKRKRA